MTILTFRMPTPVPLQTGCPIVCNYWLRLNINAITNLYSLYVSRGGKDEFIPFVHSLFVTDRGVIDFDLN